jgi:hypothetical protein
MARTRDVLWRDFPKTATECEERFAAEEDCGARFGAGAPGRWTYDQFQTIRGGLPFPYRRGVIPLDRATPTTALNLMAGEWICVKSNRQIPETLNTKNFNNGTGFDVEMVPYCGGIYRVKSRAHTFMTSNAVAENL